jgi:asparaginyl-tRNA synthetase
MNISSFPDTQLPSIDEIKITGRLTRIREQKKFIFGEIDDGSTHRLQFIYKILGTGSRTQIAEFIKTACVGSSVTLTGTLVKAPEKATQKLELDVTDASVISTVREPKTYLYGLGSLKQRSPEDWVTYMKGIREDKYMRFRHKIIATVMRLRGKSQAELIGFFHELGFIKVDTPILTESDCEGAGEMFAVTSLDLAKVPKTMAGEVDYSQDFFGKPCYLSVSGQCEAEALAQCLHKVFTFGPTFRAEHSLTSRHLAEFWMLEPELVFTKGTVEERFHALMDLEEDMVIHIISYMLTTCLDDIKILDSTCSPGLIEKLMAVKEKKFARATYTECIETLKNVVAQSKTDEFEDADIFWGMDLGSEHERYLCEKVYKRPTFVTHYPQDLKSFYMKADVDCPPDRITCQAVDLLVPGIGELCGGSMREDDPDKLLAVMEKKGMSVKSMQWYVDLRYDGALPTGGFGLGFERLISFITGVKSVRDVSAFPRYYRSM